MAGSVWEKSWSGVNRCCRLGSCCWLCRLLPLLLRSRRRRCEAMLVSSFSFPPLVSLGVGNESSQRRLVNVRICDRAAATLPAWRRTPSWKNLLRKKKKRGCAGKWFARLRNIVNFGHIDMFCGHPPSCLSCESFKSTKVSLYELGIGFNAHLAKTPPYS